MFLKKNMIFLKDKKGFTPYKLKNLGIPLTTSQQIINGTTTDPRISIIIKLSEIYKISIEELLLKDLEKEWEVKQDV